MASRHQLPTQYTQAKTIIARFGGVAPLAKLLGVTRVSVWRWTQPRIIGGTDGLVPAGRIPSILELAKIHDIDIPATDWLPV